MALYRVCHTPDGTVTNTTVHADSARNARRKVRRGARTTLITETELVESGPEATV
jgi:hypothetical protein